ncbi:MAG: hypothetical protein ACLQDF_04150 [Desulfomonilia bacterium]
MEQASAKGSRSTILRPIGWMMPICVASTLSSIYLNSPIWLICMFAIFCGLTMVLYLGSYIFCLLTDKDALRSETYSIQKMAIEKGFVGDSLVGKIGAEQFDQINLIEANKKIKEGDNK